jgi:hypothetical protein
MREWTKSGMAAFNALWRHRDSAYPDPNKSMEEQPEFFTEETIARNRFLRAQAALTELPVAKRA